MKTTHLLFIGMIAAFSSCSTAYRSGQTPDDVYYSPAPAPVETYVTSDNQQDRNAYGYSDDEDQDIRRGIQDPRYRNSLSSSISLGIGSGYGYNPYGYSQFGGYGYDPYGYNGYGYGSYGNKGFYDPYGYNSYYSPYYSGIGYGGIGYGGGFGGYYSPIYSYYPGIGGVTGNTNVGPRRVNLAAFNSATTNRINEANQGVNTGSHPSSMPVRGFGVRQNQSGSIGRQQQGSGVGNVIRRVFTPSENRSSASDGRTFNNNNQSYRNDNNSRPSTQPTRSFDNTPSSNTNSSPAPSSAPVRTFRK